jgi:hypothetical protein
MFRRAAGDGWRAYEAIWRNSPVDETQKLPTRADQSRADPCFSLKPSTPSRQAMACLGRLLITLLLCADGVLVQPILQPKPAF